MKVFITSDLHLGENEKADKAINKLAGFCCQQAVAKDVLLVLGDIASLRTNLIKFAKSFSNFSGVKLFVLGNHDIWTSENSNSSYEKIVAVNDFLREFGFINIEYEPQKIADLLFLGSMGWYDYSFKDNIGIADGFYRSKTYPGEVKPAWTDAFFAHFDKPDDEVVHEQIVRLVGQLKKSQNQRIIMGFHHLCHKRQLVYPRIMVSKRWRFLNAFLGSQNFHRAIVKNLGSNIVEHVFCGHVHFSKTTCQDSIVYTSIGSDYDKKELLIYDSSSRNIDKLVFG